MILFYFLLYNLFVSLCILVIVLVFVVYVSFFYCFCYRFVIFFFFKKKTAYELRISDLSSDVCSSDLSAPAHGRRQRRRRRPRTARPCPAARRAGPGGSSPRSPSYRCCGRLSARRRKPPCSPRRWRRPRGTAHRAGERSAA